MKVELLKIINDSIVEINEHLEKKIDVSSEEQTLLYSGDGTLDSLSLVNLIVSIEEKVAEKFGKAITLADEKAFSQKHSPFRSIESLLQYLDERLNDGII